MRRSRTVNTVRSVFAALFVTLPLGGCGTPSDSVHTSALETAMQRWDRCVNSVTSDNATAAGDSTRDRLARVTRDCDGHRRDIALSLPARLESRVYAALASHERRRAGEQPFTARLESDAEGSALGEFLRSSRSVELED